MSSRGRIMDLAQFGSPRNTFKTLKPTNILLAICHEAENATTNQIHLIGSGVAAGDIDNDGLVDLYFYGQTTGYLFHQLNRSGLGGN